jgi:hypothetical protein
LIDIQTRYPEEASKSVDTDTGDDTDDDDFSNISCCHDGNTHTACFDFPIVVSSSGRLDAITANKSYL